MPTRETVEAALRDLDRLKLRLLALLEEAEASEASATAPDGGLVRADGRLTEAGRAFIHDRFLAEEPASSVARTMGISPTAVRYHFRKLKEIFTKSQN